MKKVTIIGTGMDGIKTLTKEAENAINNADVLIGAKRILNIFDGLGKVSYVCYNSKEIAEYIKNCDHENIAVLMSGDCGFYSGAAKLLPLLSGYEANVICGISSPVYLCSKLNENWNDIKFISLHGRENSIARNAASYEKTFFLLGGDVTVRDVCKTLCEYDLSDLTVHIGENLAGESERISSGIASDFTDLKTDNLCVVLVINKDYERYKKCGIADSEFIRGNVPMTKSEVRGLCVLKLEIERNGVCWDIGAGTGSVSVEMAIQCPEGKVYAVERNDEAIDLIKENCRKFHCDNVEIIKGNAAETVSSLPAPDCVFIGGSGGELKEIITCAKEKNPDVRIVATAVSLETLNECKSVLGEAEITQIAVTRTKKAGRHTMLSAENPIFIIRGK